MKIRIKTFITERFGVLFALSFLLVGSATFAQDKSKIAKEVVNPLTTMFFIPLQYNFEPNIGITEKGHKSSVFLQPIIPLRINEKWNIITRPIIPFYSQVEIYEGAGSQAGLGDINHTIILTPSHSSSSGFAWGAGAVLSYPTATNELLGYGKFGLGPTLVLLQSKGPFLYGLLSNHIWSVAGNSDRSDMSLTYFQPVFNYTTNRALTFSFISETTYDWISKAWSIPLVFTASQLIQFGNQMITIGGGARYWIDNNEVNPQNWGFTLSLNILFPK